MSKHKQTDVDADADAEVQTNEYGHDLDRTVYRKGTHNGKSGSIYHLNEDCRYLSNVDTTIPCKLRTLPSHRPCKLCTDDITHTGPAEFQGLRNLVNKADDKLSNSVFITRNSWEENDGCYHVSQTCVMPLRADDVVEVHIEALPNLCHEPCDYCCDDEIKKIEQILTDRYNVDNPDKRLTVGDLSDHTWVWVSLNANNKSLAHLSVNCRHLDRANDPSKKMAQTLHSDRGICKECSDERSDNSDGGRYNSLAHRLRDADNPKELLNEESTN